MARVAAGGLLLAIIAAERIKRLLFGPHARHAEPHRWFAWHPVRAHPVRAHPVGAGRHWVWLQPVLRSTTSTQCFISFEVFHYERLPADGPGARQWRGAR